MFSLQDAAASNGNQTAISLGHTVTHNERLRQANNDVNQLTEILSDSLQGLRNQYGILKVLY